MATLIINGKNSGKDVSVIIKASTGQSVLAEQLGIMTEFECDCKDDHFATKSIIQGGRIFNEVLPVGVTASMKFARYNGGLTDLAIAYRNAKKQGVEMFFTLSWNVLNRDGLVDTYQLTYCKPMNPKLGHFAASQDVIQSINWECSEIVKTGGGTNLFAVA